jgi:hypothetical protein
LIIGQSIERFVTLLFEKYFILEGITRCVSLKKKLPSVPTDIRKRNIQSSGNAGLEFQRRKVKGTRRVDGFCGVPYKFKKQVLYLILAI